jgi:hypothetical protein
MDLTSLNTPGFQRGYKIFSWTFFACLVLVIVLILHKSPAPDVRRDPAAAARVEQKFAAVDQAKAQGQPPAQVQLDSTELNSYLAQNLEIPDAQSSASAPPSITRSGSPTQVPASPAEPGAMSTLQNQNQNQPSLEEIQSSVRDVKVDMDGDLIKAYVIFNVHGEDLSLELDGHLGAENGYMKFEPVAGKLGSLPLPQSMLDAAVNQLMNSPENREKLRLPDDVSDISIQNGQAVLSYK